MADPILISSFQHAKQSTGGVDMPLDVFRYNIAGNTWADHFLDFKLLGDDKAAQDAYKENKLPYVTPSGTFSRRRGDGLIKHSGILALDIDDVDPEETKAKFKNDKYVYFAFTTISGKGVCAFIKIDGKKHAEAFEGAQEYFRTRYSIVLDDHCKDIPRARFVSHDPHPHYNALAERFAEYPKQDKILYPSRVPSVVFVEEDFNMVMQEIGEKRIDITGRYQSWLRIGFAFADKFGEAGRAHYHAVSENSALYSPEICDRQYTSCLKSGKEGVNIATFYYLAKQAGCTITSPRTREILRIAAAAKSAHTDQKAAIKRAAEEGFEGAGVADIVEQVFVNNIDVPEQTEIEALEFWLKENYTLRRNSITRYLESGPTVLQKKDFNTIWVAGKKVFEKLAYPDLERLIDSDLTPTYNPLQDFISEHKHRNAAGNIARLFASLRSDTGDADYAEYFGRKWLVGIISSIYGQHSPLMLVLTGPQNTGKSEFFRRLLPAPLLRYYAESKLDKEKDDEILMTQKLIIMNDEMGGSTAKDEKRIKELTSKQVFSLREPYGKGNVDLQRLAVLGGTTNNLNVLGDPTGNRRLLPVNTPGIDFAAYNAIDKTDLLIEAYGLYKDGFAWQMSKEDILRLNSHTETFEKVSPERDLIQTRFALPTNRNENEVISITPTRAKEICEEGRTQLNSTRFGQEMQKMGFEKTKIDTGNGRAWMYRVVLKTTSYIQITPAKVVTMTPF